uniref:Sushi domain-containing protein n=1 Tax=Pelusios castaneus TaxID=367368 RepID=A0A8C8SRB8_9SAUR
FSPILLVRKSLWTVPCDFPNIENGALSDYYKNHRERAFPAQLGVKIYYKCHNGYISTSEESWNLIRCTREGWNPMPKCLKKCSPYFLVNGKYQYLRGKTYKEGDEISYVCEPEYSPANQQAKVTCTKNDWSPTPRCISNRKHHLCSTVKLVKKKIILRNTSNREVQSKQRFMRCIMENIWQT